MNKLIVLRGRHDSGKTQTLNLLIDLLEVATTGCEMPLPQPIGHERKRSFNYQGKTIGVATLGDDKPSIESNCNFFLSNKCDIAFSASRTWGITCKELNRFAEEQDYQLQWVKRCIVSSGFEEIALKQAKKLVGYI